MERKQRNWVILTGVCKTALNLNYTTKIGENMRSLFVHDHKFPKNKDEYYYSYGFDKEFFNRYINIFEEIDVIGRYKNIDNIKTNNGKIEEKIEFLTIRNLSDLLNKNTRKMITKKVSESKYIVVRLPSILGMYVAWKARKMNKPYLTEVVGCYWDAVANKGGLKIIPALILTGLMKRIIKSSSYVVYVTEEFLERRYPTKGRYIACSNVTLNSVNKVDLDRRIEQIEKKDSKKIIMGTCATVDVIYKGQQDVIKAISILKNQGYEIEYQLVGGGDTSYLESIAKECGVSDQIKFVGPLEHEKVFMWLENIDLYVHPSKQEGLSRAIIEAMSKGCPVFGANAGGIHELIDKEYIFAKGNIKQICSTFKKFNKKTMREQSIKNHNNSKKYLKEILYARRENFFNGFKTEYK